MIKFLVFIQALFFGLVATASEVEHAAAEHAEAIPLDKIGWQAANLGILLVIIVYFGKKPIVDMFAKRRTGFIEQSEKTKSLLLQAEADLKEIKNKISTLESGEAKSLATAQHEANLIKANLIKDSEAQAAKLKVDAEVAIRNELAKAKEEINQLILKEAVTSAKEKLSQNNAQAQAAIETQFLAQVDRAKTSGASL